MSLSWQFHKKSPTVNWKKQGSVQCHFHETEILIALCSRTAHIRGATIAIFLPIWTVTTKFCFENQILTITWFYQQYSKLNILFYCPYFYEEMNDKIHGQDTKTLTSLSLKIRVQDLAVDGFVGRCALDHCCHCWFLHIIIPSWRLVDINTRN